MEFEQGVDSVMVCIGLTRAGVVLRPHFIQGNLNTREYLQIIRYHVIQRDFPRNNINRQVMWCQQEGVPARTSNVTLQYLRGQFPGTVMSERGEWPCHHVLSTWQFVTFSVGISEATDMGRTSQSTTSDSKGI